ncbi:hypothetical protein F2Q69_00019187 [Brassica cretica]|uniref:V-type proton ATPase subunit a n=1 Tax=Brassica cretica TaxID=69181 RepID=A0A8S9QKI6_BRACR|nr:hypothetical protein F2Q69_00019187 [Brassica cretica]
MAPLQLLTSEFCGLFFLRWQRILGSGERQARLRERAVAGGSRFSVKAVRFLVSLSSPSSPRFALPELWFNPHPEALTRGGGYESSVVAGSCLREVVGFFSIASSVLSTGAEGFQSLASPALVELSGGLVFGPGIAFGFMSYVARGSLKADEISKRSMKLSAESSPQRGQKVEEKWFRWRLSGFELRRNEGFGGGATAASRFGDGQVEAKATRGALMIKFQHASRLLDAWAKRRRSARLGLSCLVWALAELKTTIRDGLDHRKILLETIGDKFEQWNLKVRKEKAIYHTLNMLSLDVTATELKTTIRDGLDHRKILLETIGDKFEQWNLKVRKEKAIYHTLNMLSLDVTKKCLVGEGWSPLFAVPERRCNELRLTPIIKLDQFSSAAKYQEANPTVFTIVTFPFLFAVMFGDWGHGICLLLATMYLILREKKLSSQFVICCLILWNLDGYDLPASLLQLNKCWGWFWIKGIVNPRLFASYIQQ